MLKRMRSRPATWVIVFAVLPALAWTGCQRSSEPPSSTGDSVQAGTGSAPGAGSPERDHVLLITVDTLRADTLGFAGDSRVATPVLDRLAASGRTYLNAHAHSVVTLPSHANILTGRYPYQHGVRENSGFVLPAEEATAATILAERGFATAAFVAAYPLDSRFGLARGFAVYDDAYARGSHPTEFVMPERRGDEVVAAARAWWQSHADERRFLWLHLYEPHAPYSPPEPFASHYATNPYLGEVAAVDAFLAPLLEPFLDGEEAPTLIVFTSDHGEGLGDHGELTHGLFAYEPTLKVPLVVWAPDMTPHRTSEHARHIDILPTLLAAAGVDPPPGLPGRNLLAASPAAAGESYFEALSANLNRGWAPLRGVVERGEKLISLPIPELYDLSDDPGEARNLFEARPDRARELARHLPRESEWPPTRAAPGDREMAALRSLGYVVGDAARESSYTEADDPKNLVALDRKVHQVIDLYQRGRLAAAETLAREVVSERPGMGVGYTHLAQVLLESGQLDEALAVMLEANRRGVASESLLRQLGLTLAQAGRADEAVEVLTPLAREGAAETLSALGVALSDAGRHEEARRTLLNAIEADPDDPVAYERLALVATRRGDWTDAREQARRALDRNEDLTEAWNYLGGALFNLGQPHQAIAAWRQAVDRDEENYDALFNLALVAREVGEVEQAREALRRFVADAPPERYGPDIANARGWLAEVEE